MKFCMHCGKEVKEQVKFCPFCGGDQKEVSATASGEESVVTSRITIDQESINQLADKGKNYFAYINKNIRNPILGASNQNGYFGVVTYVLLNVLIALSISHALGKNFSSTFSLELFLPLLLLFLVGQFVNVVAVYLLSNKIFKVRLNLVDTFERIYGPISLAIYGAIIMLALSFISTYGFSMLFVLFLVLIFFLISVSFVANLWRTENLSPNKNRFYWTIGALILAGIAHLIVNLLLSDMIGASIAHLFEEIIDSIFSSMFY